MSILVKTWQGWYGRHSNYMVLKIGFVFYCEISCIILTVLGKIFAFMLDNATNNNTMVEGIQRQATLEGIVFNATWAHLRCLPHTVHLAAVKVGWLLVFVTYFNLKTIFIAPRSYWRNFQRWEQEGDVPIWQLSAATAHQNLANNTMMMLLVKPKMANWKNISGSLIQQHVFCLL